MVSYLSQGSKGEEVRLLQEKLKSAGYDPGPIDADFGPRTKAAVKAYQQAKGLDPDSVVGPLTWSALQGLTPAAPAATPTASTRSAPEADAIRRAAGLGIPENQVDPGYLNAARTGTADSYIAGAIRAGQSMARPSSGPSGSGGGAGGGGGVGMAYTPVANYSFPSIDLTPRYDYSPQIRDILSRIQSGINAAPPTSQDIVASPEYLAQKNLLDLQLGEGMAGLRRDLASRGMLRGDTGIQTLAQATTEGGIRAGALIPTMIQTAQGQRQQALANQFSSLGAFAGQQQAGETAAYNEAKLAQDIADANRQFGLSQAGVTGLYGGAQTQAAREAALADQLRQQELNWQRQFQGGTLAQAQAEQDWQRQFQEAGLTGTYGGQPTQAAREATLADQLRQAELAASREYQQGQLDIERNKPAAAPKATYSKANTDKALKIISDAFDADTPIEDIVSEVTSRLAGWQLEGVDMDQLYKLLDRLKKEE